MIAVTFALPSESSAFLALLRNRQREGAHAISGTLHGRDVYVLHTGVGERSTRTRFVDLLRAHPPQLVVSTGFAGALHRDWNVGDLLYAENYSTAPSELSHGIDCRPGRLVTASAMIDSIAERERLARDGADAVDMETQHIAVLCAAAQVPLLSLRAISDAPAAPFPLPPEKLFDLGRQRTVILPLLFHLLRHPSAMGRLILFARQVARTRQTLAAAVAAIVARV